MNMWKLIYGILLVWGMIAGAQAQQVDKKAGELFRRAKIAFQEGEREKALELLHKAKTLDQNFSALYLLEADIYHKKGEQPHEIAAIEKALSLDSLKNHPYYYFVLAEYYFDKAAYGKALEYYREYLSRDKRLQVKSRAVRQIENCEFALAALQSQTKRPVEVFYEAEYPVYWPAVDVMGRTLLFTAQDGEQEQMWMQKDSMRYLLDFGTAGNCGTPSLTADGRTMYFSMNGGKNGFDIYVAYRLTDSTWSEPVNLGYPVNTEDWDAQPAVSADGTRLFFASTRSGGRGGSDIWFSRLLKRELNGRQIWSQPRCLYFNTAGDEMAPFLYFDNKTLFFSSDGYPGMGGKDIYKVDIDEVTSPLNIGITVNTGRDELGFIVDGSGEWGYFSSDVSGKRCIYRYRLDEWIICPPAAYICLQAENEAGMLVTPDHLTLVEVENGDTLAYYEGRYADGQMLACVPVNKLLLVGAMKKGYLYYSDTLQVRAASPENPQVYTVHLKPVQKDQTFVLKGIFFDVDDYHLKPESWHELQQLVLFLQQNPEVSVEIGGHTDDTGNDKHNYQLSEDRAFEVYKFLFMKHIPKERMEYKGYGKEKPLAPNDTEIGRAANRRTEIRIK